jgi:glycosyltransferase involved in cell wall biosynthesis
LKILHLSNDVGKVGNGIVNVMVDLACQQSEQGHEVVVISGGGEYLDLLKKHEVRHIFLRQRPIKKIEIPLSVLKFIWFVHIENPDVVHAHMVTGLFLARIAKCFRRYILVSTVHNEFNASAKYMGLADHVIGVSNAVSKSMIRRGVPPERISTVCNGIVGTPRREELNCLQDVSLQHPNVITVAGLFRRKGIDILIKAFSKSSARTANAHLYIIGEGRDRKEFESLVVELGLTENVHFLGFQEDVTRYLRQSDIFVLASLREPFGLAILEAREAGCAIIASDVDGIPEALDNGVSGTLFPAGDVDFLSEELSRLIGDSDYLVSARNKAGIGVERFTTLGMSNAYLEIYKNLLIRFKNIM